MPNKDCDITIVTHFLFKNWDGDSKYNIETSVENPLQSRTGNNYNYFHKIFISGCKNDVKYTTVTSYWVSI